MNDKNDNDVCQQNLFEYIKQTVVFAGYFSVYYCPDFLFTATYYTSSVEFLLKTTS
jgi:hypothetical protein